MIVSEVIRFYARKLARRINMATPTKQPKREEAETASVSGLIMNVSPMKTSKKGFPYFNACIQEKDKTSGIVAFNENKRKELKLLEEQR